jgi:hypothetical protein
MRSCDPCWLQNERRPNYARWSLVIDTVRGGKQIHHHQIGAAQRFIIFAGFGNRDPCRHRRLQFWTRRSASRVPRRSALRSDCAWPTVSSKFTNRVTDAVPILHTRAPVSAPALAPAIVGAFYLPKASGNLAIFTAIRRASSFVSSLI